MYKRMCRRYTPHAHLALESKVHAACNRDTGHIWAERLLWYASPAAREPGAALALRTALLVARERRRWWSRWIRLDVTAAAENDRSTQDRLVVVDALVKAASLTLRAAVDWRRRGRRECTARVGASRPAESGGVGGDAFSVAAAFSARAALICGRRGGAVAAGALLKAVGELGLLLGDAGGPAADGGGGGAAVDGVDRVDRVDATASVDASCAEDYGLEFVVQAAGAAAELALGAAVFDRNCRTRCHRLRFVVVSYTEEQVRES